MSTNSSTLKRKPFTVIAHTSEALRRAIMHYGDTAEATILITPMFPKSVFTIPDREYACSFATDHRKVTIIAPDSLTITPVYKENPFA